MKTVTVSPEIFIYTHSHKILYIKESMELFRPTYGTPRAMDSQLTIPSKGSRTDSSNRASYDQKKQLKAVRDGLPAQKCKKTRYLETMEISNPSLHSMSK